MSESALSAFASLLKSDQSLRERVRTATGPQHVVQLAKDNGHDFTAATLMKVSAEKIKADLRNQAEKDAKKLKDDAQAQIEVEKDKAISEIRQEVVSLTMSVAEKVIGKNLSSEDNQKLIEKSIKNLREYEA